MQSVPVFLRHCVHQAFILALRALREAYARGTAPQQTRAWKLFLLLPRLLLHRAREPGNVGREALVQRARDFLAGRWDALLLATRAAAGAPRRTLDETPMPPTTTLARGVGHSHAPTAPAGAAARGACCPPQLPVLTDAAVAQALRTARRGTAAGLSGATCDHYKLLLEDAEALELLTHAANLLVAARVPADVAAALGLSRLTALRRPGGGVRGIATGDTFRRLVSRSLARTFADTLTMHASRRELRPGECLAAFLDDVYLVTTPARSREALDVVTASIETRAGVAANLGKTRVYNRAGGPELGAGVSLGTPIGHPTYVGRTHAHASARGGTATAGAPTVLPDLQCAWLLLSMCASPRADHLLRTLPPDLSASYARGNDDAVWRCLLWLLGEAVENKKRGLGLQCAERTAPAAYWAAWADALPVLHARRPDAAARCRAELAAGPAAALLKWRAACSTPPAGKAAPPMVCAPRNATCPTLA
eukprot:s2888_g1.t1